MTLRLRDHRDDLTALIQRTARALHIPVSHVEKDFWVTEVLRMASRPRNIRLPDGSSEPVTFTFKGGTSLSRVFQIIDRFSEDVDVVAHFPTGTSLQARHSVLKDVDNSVQEHLGLERKDVRVRSSTTGIKRFTVYPYRAEASDTHLKEGVVLELGTRGGRSPSTVYRFQSLVADYAMGELGDTSSTWEEFAPFDVTVLAPERTLLEKLAAVHNAASRMDTDWLLRGGRHFYDIYRLLHDLRVVHALSSLGPQGVAQIVEDIDAQSVAAEFTITPRPLGGFADSPAFDESHPSYPAIAAGIDASADLIHGQPAAIHEIFDIVKDRGSLL